MKRALFIFRRDLRVDDNTGLQAACNTGAEVTTIFCLDPRQVHPHPYRSLSAMQCMFTSLKELAEDLTSRGGLLQLFLGTAEECLQRILGATKFGAVFINRDYTPFSTKRDEALLDISRSAGAQFFASHDALLHDPRDTLKPDGTPYTVFTPFFKRNQVKIPPRPQSLVPGRFSTEALVGAVPLDVFSELLPLSSSTLFRQGGRREGLSLLRNKIPTLTRYNEERDIPAVEGTSGLSVHHKFGTVSVRESYWAAKESLAPENRFISELYWRDFLTCIGYFFPHVFGGAFQRHFDELTWEANNEHFERWCSGTTGFPIIDAGMRELNTSGFMHNRVRMIVSSFLMKDLHIDWRWGERYFAQKLIDYDPAVNNGSWQWAASTGCDAQPYFRIFNPWLQQAKFDPAATYITRWVPELAGLSPKEIHTWEKIAPLRTKDTRYPVPMVDHLREKKVAEEMYSACARPRRPSQ